MSADLYSKATADRQFDAGDETPPEPDCFKNADAVTPEPKDEGCAYCGGPLSPSFSTSPICTRCWAQEEGLA